MEDRAKLGVTTKAKAIKVEPRMRGFSKTKGFSNSSLLLQIIEVNLKVKTSMNGVVEARFLKGRL